MSKENLSRIRKYMSIDANNYGYDFDREVRKNEMANKKFYRMCITCGKPNTDVLKCCMKNLKIDASKIKITNK